MHHTPPPDDAVRCRNGERCTGYDRATKTPAAARRTAVCEPCLDAAVDAAGRDLPTLLWDFYDLEQMQAPSLAQSLTGQPNGTAAAAMPMAGAPEALQAEIVWVLTTWEDEIRYRCRLSRPRRPPAPPWHTTVSNGPPRPPGRPGAAVQRAIAVLAPRLADLARLEPVAVWPTGCDDDGPADLDGVQALAAICDLHRRARAMLGRTRRTFWVPGECSHCGAAPVRGVDGPLYRHEPRFEGDESPVWCKECDGWRALDDYHRYVLLLVWPKLHVADIEDAA